MDKITLSSPLKDAIGGRTAAKLVEKLELRRSATCCGITRASTTSAAS